MASFTTQWILILSSLLHLCMGERRVLDLQNDNSNHRDLTCPPPDMIKPCLCALDAGMNMDMDCSSVESEEQLAKVFAQDFPFLDFRELTIDGNQNLKVLREGALGNTTYKIIYITNGILQEVQHYALASSYLIADEFRFFNNNLSIFPFDELTNFTKLRLLDLYENNLSEFPIIASSSLNYLELAENDFHDSNIGSEDLQQLTDLETIGVEETGLTDLYEGTFTGLPQLRFIYLFNNQLSHLPDGIIDLNGNFGSFVDLRYNVIQSVAPNAITGVDTLIFLEDNLLTEFEEAVWRKHLEKGVNIQLKGNPLNCGCDIAWLILDSTFMTCLDSGATCANGILLTALDPNIYATLC